MTPSEKPALPPDDEPFTLDGRPKAEKPARVIDPPEKQRMLLEGLDALPGQLDLF